MGYISSVAQIRHVIASTKATDGLPRDEEVLVVWMEADVVTASGRVQTIASGVHGPCGRYWPDVISSQEDAEIELFEELRGFGVSEQELQTAHEVSVER